MILKIIRSQDGTGTLSYLIIDETYKTAAVIDPNLEDVNKIVSLADESGVKITHILDTHTHADHFSGAKKLKNICNAQIYMHEQTKNKLDVLKNASKFGVEDILNYNANIGVDVFVSDGDIISVGETKIRVFYTPGHTDNHITFLAEDALFTGDLLLIGQVGRSDLPGGNVSDQYDSIFNKIIILPGKTKIYPGHDYKENEFSYLEDELVRNPFLEKRTREEYIKLVNDYFPPFTETSGERGKVTLQCGTRRVEQSSGKFRTMSASELYEMLKSGKELFLLDVREPEELFAGKIDGVVNIPIRNLPDKLNILPDKSQDIVCICASGNRSLEAAHFLSTRGFSNILNLEGGTYNWFKNGFKAGVYE